MRSAQIRSQIVKFIYSMQNKKHYLIFFIVLGGLIYYLNNAFCLFYDHVPLGKMNNEAVMLVQKADEILIRHEYCKDYYKCVSKKIVFFRETCKAIQINFYDGIYISQEVRNELIDEIRKHSTFKIHILFYEQSFEPGFFKLHFPTTEIYIDRKKS